MVVYFLPVLCSCTIRPMNTMPVRWHASQSRQTSCCSYCLLSSAMIFMIDGKADGSSIRFIAVLPGGLGCILYNLSVENFENFCCEEVENGRGKHIMVSIGSGALRHHCAASA